MKLNRAVAYNISVIMISMIVLAGFTVAFVQHAINKNNQKFCQVLLTINGAPRPDTDLEPTTPYGKQLKEYQDKVTRDLIELQRQYKCPKGDGKP